MAVDEEEDDHNEVNEVNEEINNLLYQEEKKMDDGERLQRDAAIMEELMEGEIEGVVRKAKPVRQALFKVSLFFFFF